MSGVDNPHYQAQGQSAHPTVAGNALDPNVSADGQKGGVGVGGTSERTVEDEGAEHIGLREKARGGASSGTGFGSSGADTGYGSSGTGTGYGSSGAGIGSGLGSGADTGYGSSGAGTTGAYSETQRGAGEPSFGNQHSSGIDYIKNATGTGSTSGTGLGSGSGYGNESYSTGQTTGSGYGNDYSSGTGSGLTGGSGPTSGTGNDYSTGQTTGSGYGNDYSSASRSGASELSGDTGVATGHGNASGSGYGAEREGLGSSRTQGGDYGSAIDSQPSTRGGTDPASNTSANAGIPSDSDVRTGGDPTTSADPSTSTTQRSATASEPQTGSTDAQAKPAGVGSTNKDTSDGKGGPPSNIPTAGGERIGAKHWGESKVVPDNPPVQKDGVSSADGQGDDLTAKNTKSNTGAPGQEKESVIDKIKDKLHMGHK